MFDELDVIQRSELEQWANCPTAARLAEDFKPSVGLAAHVGEEIHQAFSRLITSFIDSGGSLNTRELRDDLSHELASSRPDVQPQVVEGAKRSAWDFCNYLSRIHHENILRYDGGEGQRSGQLAHDLPELGLRITSEVDCLHASESPELLIECDYKTGWRAWDESNVRNSFQFGLHWWLIAENYPGAKALRVTVWDTRRNRRTYPVDFTRDDLPQISARIRAAAGEYLTYHDRPPEQVPAWPAPSKCRICDVASRCPVAERDLTTLDPADLLDAMVAVKAKLYALTEIAAGYVDRTGKDIVSKSGAAFGTGKPKASRKPTKALYQLNRNGDTTE